MANGKHYAQCIRVGEGPIPDVLPPLPQNIIDLRNKLHKLHHGDFATVV
jgi:hypothetical protein